MSATAEGRKPARRYAVARRLAPHVAEKWAESFIVELRLIGIEGSRIGAALSEVESHCNESGQSAQEAFGDPVEYARSLQLPVDDDPSTRATLRSMAPMVVQVAGMSMLNWGFEYWLRGQQLEITAGHLVNASIALLGMAAITGVAEPMLRMAVYHPILMWLALMASMAIFVISLIFLDVVIWRVSAGLGLAAGGAVLMGGTAWAVMRHRASGSEEDPVTSPFDDAGTPSRLGALVGAVTIWMIPVGTVLLLAVTLVLHQMSAT